MSLSRRRFLGFSARRGPGEPMSRPVAGRSTLEEFYATRGRVAEPPLVCDPTIVYFEHTDEEETLADSESEGTDDC